MSDIDTQLGCCGIDCSSCEVFSATLQDSDEQRAQCLPKWEQNAKLDCGTESLSISDINCLGCQSEHEQRFISCRNCAIRSCCKRKGHATCAECVDRERCTKLQGLFDNVLQARENIERLAAELE